MTDPYDPYSGSSEEYGIDHENSQVPPETSQSQFSEPPKDNGEQLPENPPQEEKKDGPENQEKVHRAAVYRSGSFKRNRGLIGGIFLALAALLAALIVPGLLYRLESVQVEFVGSHTYTADQVVAASGLVVGRNMLQIEENDVISSLQKDRHLVFRSMEKDYTHRTIRLQVEERKAVAAYRRYGSAYLLDEEGMVMDVCEMKDIPEGFPVITGFDVVSVNVGQPLSLRNSSQLEAYQAMMKEIKATDGITEINLSDADDIYAEISGINDTNKTISIRFGNNEYMHAKFTAMRVYMDFILQLDTGGVLDVSIPEDAKFRPDN